MSTVSAICPVMKQTLIIYIIFSVFAMISNELFGTAQFGDLLISEKDTVTIYTNPLEQYLEKKGKRTIGGHELLWTCTAVYRGYVATWELSNDSLFLVGIEINNCGNDAEELDLIKEFNCKRVFAEWFSGTIRSELGNLLSYIHAGYGSIYEKECYYKIQNGAVTSTTDTNYVVYDKSRVYPGIRSLDDTLTRIIYSHLDTTEFYQFQDHDLLTLTILFNQEGKIQQISPLHADSNSYMVQMILATAIKSLRGFPKIMKVNHIGYSSPVIWIGFDSHCLKHPEDSIYGCANYRQWINPDVYSACESDRYWSNNKKWVFFFISGLILLSCWFFYRRVF